MIARPRPLRALAFATAFALAALSTFPGCSTAPRLAPSTDAPLNVRGLEFWPSHVRRVAVLPAHDASGALPEAFVSSYDALWASAVGDARRAEVVTLDRATIAKFTGRTSVSSTDPLPAPLLQHVARESGADAVLFLDLTHVSPYPPLSLGFRAKLVVLSDAEIVWAVDEQFDTDRLGKNDPTLKRSPSALASRAFRSVTSVLPRQKVPQSAKTSAERAD